MKLNNASQFKVRFYDNYYITTCWNLFRGVNLILRLHSYCTAEALYIYMSIYNSTSGTVLTLIFLLLCVSEAQPCNPVLLLLHPICFCSLNTQHNLCYHDPSFILTQEKQPKNITFLYFEFCGYIICVINF